MLQVQSLLSDWLNDLAHALSNRTGRYLEDNGKELSCWYYLANNRSSECGEQERTTCYRYSKCYTIGRIFWYGSMVIR